MIINAHMDLHHLADRMGGTATREDAQRFRAILVEAGYTGVDTRKVPPSEWHRMLDLVEDAE